MTSRALVPLFALLAALSGPVASAQRAALGPVDLSVTPCESCAEWNEPQRPFRIFGNTYYVGTRGLSAFLITSPAGHILIDGALAESAPLIAASVRALGFKLEDVKVLLNTHAHYDHAGGLAALQRASGARVLVHPWSARVLRTGSGLVDDPQRGYFLPLPAVRVTRVLADAEVIRVGPLAVTAWFTGGHTPGGTSFGWRSCEGDTCWSLLLADSQTPIADATFRFSGGSRYPTVLQDFANARRRFETVPCDVLLTPHPGVSSIFERQAKRDAGDGAAFRDPGACRAYAEKARQRLEARLREEGAGRP